MRASDLTLFCGGRFFVWAPHGYRVFGFFHKGAHYVFLTLKVDDGWGPKPKLISDPIVRYLDVDRAIL